MGAELTNGEPRRESYVCPTLAIRLPYVCHTLVIRLSYA